MGSNLASQPLARSTTTSRSDKGALAAIYPSIALLSIAVWDTLLCIRIEYLTIWRADSSFLKWLYLATRYLGLGTGALLVGSFSSKALSTSRDCKVLSKVVIAFATTACFVRLLLRTYRIIAIYRFNRPFVGVLSFASLSTTIIQAYLVTGWVALTFPSESTGCYPVPNPAQRWVGPVYWGALVLESSLLLVLLISRTIARYKASGESTFVLLSLLWNDGARFQAMLFSVNLTAFTLSFLTSSFPGLFFLPFASVGSSTLLCRLVHSLRPRSRSNASSSSAQRLRPQDRQTSDPNYLCGEFGSFQSQGDRQSLPITTARETSTTQRTSPLRDNAILPI